MTPPVATPTRNTISPTLFRYSLSQTRFHSDIHVFPSLSVMSNSHAVHLMRPVVGDVEFFTSPSLCKWNSVEAQGRRPRGAANARKLPIFN